MWYHLFTAAVLGVLYTYSVIFVCIIPWLGYDTVTGIAVLASYLFLLSLFLVCYLRAIFTDPGPVPAIWKDSPITSQRSDAEENIPRTRENQPEGEKDDDQEKEAARDEEQGAAGNVRTSDTNSPKEWGDEKSNAREELEKGEGSLLNHESAYALETMPLMEERGMKYYEGGVDEPDETAWPYCKVCRKFKPMRTHHCKICKRCTLKMDHHCKWLNNCVGFRNHKFFIQALITGFTGCIFVLVISILRPIFKPFPISEQWNEYAFLIDFILYCASGVSVVLQVFSLGGMVFFHLFLISHNMTHIEFNCCRGRATPCRYNRGTWFNLKELLGQNILLWLLPIHTPPPGLEGDNFQPVSDEEAAQTSVDQEGFWRHADKFASCCQCFT